MSPPISANPKVFISYSHDSPDHESRVLALSDRLRREGIDAILDQYESFPPRGWILWMKQQVRDADCVLVVCTEIYQRRADREEKPGVGLGATFESQLVQQLLYDAGGVNEKFIPVVLTDSDRQHIPVELRRFTHFSVHTEEGYDGLYRLLTNQPRIEKLVIGPRRALAARERKADFRNVVWNVPARNPFFTGRDSHLESIHEALEQNTSGALTQPPAISGLGGIGKTQTAIEYAYRYRANYAAVLWTLAESHASLLAGFAALAQVLNLAEKDEKDLSVVASAVRRWLESNSGWLLIFDNVEDFTLARQFTPAYADDGHVLITTRLRASGDFAELVELKKMEPDEGALFLLRRAKLIAKDKSLEAASETDRALARQMSEEVGGLPLALDQAGAFIEETFSTLSEYLALYRAEGAALRARRGELAPNRPSVTKTFSLAFARVDKANPAAGDLVRACAFLAPDAIPEEIFTEGGSELGAPLAELVGKPLAWVKAVQEAARFAVIDRDAKNKNLNIHRLVQEVMKDEMDADTRRQWAERVVHALAETFPSVEFETWTQCERLLPHARVAARLVAEFGFASSAVAGFLNKSGSYLDDRARYEEAEPLYRRSLAIYEKALGPEHPDTARSLNNLALLYDNQGRYEEAEPLYRRSLAIDEKALGPEHPDTARSLNNLALLYDNQGRYEEAEPLYRRALAIKEKALGPEHPNTATSLNNLALLYRNQGRYEEAEPLYRRALAITEKALGPEHPNTATSLNNLAGLYDNQGRYEEAEPLYRRSLAIYEKALGPEHPNTATSLNNLAGLYDIQGRYEEAEPLYRRALAITEKALGPEHPNTATSLNNLALLYRNQGRYEEAEPLYRRALAIKEKALGPEHPNTATSLNNLALLYAKQGRYEEAEPLYRRALAIKEKALGPEHPNTATSLNNLALLYRNQGRYEEAEPLYRRALAIHEKALGPEHPNTATSLNNLAGLYAKQGRYEEAEPLYRRALAIKEKALGPEHPHTAQSLNNLAALLRELGRGAEAEELEGRGKR